MKHVKEIITTLRSKSDHASGQGQEVCTGLILLDHEISSLPQSSLIVAGGRPNNAATAWSFQVAARMAIEEKRSTLVFSTEMLAPQAIALMLLQRGRLDTRWLHTYRIAPDMRVCFDETAAEFDDVPLCIEDAPVISIRQIRENLKEMQSRHGEDRGLIVIDSLQGISPLHGRECSERDCDNVMFALKEMIEEFKVTIITTTRLRDRRLRMDRRPKLRDLPHAVIAQHADLLVFLYSKWVYEPIYDLIDDDHKQDAEVCIKRNRSNPMFSRQWIPHRENLLYRRFEDIECVGGKP